MCHLIYRVKDGYNQKQSVGYSTDIVTVLFYHLTSEDSKHYVLANLLCSSWMVLAIESGLGRH